MRGFLASKGRSTSQYYNLGDIVIIIHKSWGININLRIVEIHEVYENNKKEIFILLGDTLPSIIDLIDKEV